MALDKDILAKLGSEEPAEPTLGQRMQRGARIGGGLGAGWGALTGGIAGNMAHNSRAELLQAIGGNGAPPSRASSILGVAALAALQHGLVGAGLGAGVGAIQHGLAADKRNSQEAIEKLRAGMPEDAEAKQANAVAVHAMNKWRKRYREQYADRIADTQKRYDEHQKSLAEKAASDVLARFKIAAPMVPGLMKKLLGQAGAQRPVPSLR